MKPKEQKIFVLALIATLAFLESLFLHNAYYTEGEIGTGFFFLLVLLNIPLFVISFWKPRYPAWLALGLGALLIAWQTSENTRLAKLHEEAVSIVYFADKQKTEKGFYPADLSDYDFIHPRYEDHFINYRVEKEGDVFRFSYFIDGPSITFWYDSETGFDYYGD